jgi:ketosteroid isomerase-like protein
MRAAILAAALATAVASPTLAQSKATIDKLNDGFAAAFNKGDAKAVGAMYGDNAVVLPPGAPMVKGRKDIEAFWKGAHEQFGDMKLTALDVAPLGANAAREIGRFTLKTKGAQPQEIVGKYVVVWHKVRGGWKLGTDIWNTDK